MNKGNINVAVVKFFTFLLSTIITIFLLENAGVDVSKGNIISFSNFSFSVFLLWVICLYSFEKAINKIRNFVTSVFFKQTTSGGKKT